MSVNVMTCMAVALRKLEKNGTSVEVRETVAGALWILEERVKKIKATKPGLYFDVSFRQNYFEMSTRNSTLTPLTSL